VTEMYTFAPKEPHAKASGKNIKISRKNATILCRVIRKKQLKKVPNLLSGLVEGRRKLKGKSYTNAAKEMLRLVESCERNAEARNLDTDRCIVYASAHTGTMIMRRRRKQGFGHRMKMTNMEIIIVEKPGKEQHRKQAHETKHEEKHEAKHDTTHTSEKRENK